MAALEAMSLLHPFIAFNQGRQFAEQYIMEFTKLTCGGMCGAATATAALYSKSAVGRVPVYYLAIFLWIAFTASFCLIKRAEISEYWVWKLSATTVVGIYLAGSKTADQLVPLIPISVSVGILFAAYVLPEVLRRFQRWKRSIPLDDTFSVRSVAATTDPDSIRSTGILGSVVPFPPWEDAYSLSFRHMSHEEMEHALHVMASPLEEGLIDLELGLAYGNSSTITAGEPADALL